MDTGSIKGIIYLVMLIGGLTTGWAILQTVIASKWKARYKTAQSESILLRNKIKELEIDLKTQNASADEISAGIDDILAAIDRVDPDVK